MLCVWSTGKPKHHGINKIKAVRNLRSVAEERVGAKYSNMRVLNSYWINQDATFKYYEASKKKNQHKKKGFRIEDLPITPWTTAF